MLMLYTTIQTFEVKRSEDKKIRFYSAKAYQSIDQVTVKTI